MNEQLANNLQITLGISQEQIVREEYEMLILKALYESEAGKFFVFKGGTALRLAYGSPRFSEDLDFSVIKNFNKKKVEAILKSVASQNPTLELLDIRQKYFTFFALFKIKEEFMTQSFSIKFEASTRPINWKKDKDYQLLALNSKVTSLTVLVQTATLEKIKQEKLSIKPPRIRDIFDLWFINQKLGTPGPLDFQSFNLKVVKRELHKFLPRQDRRLLEPWLTKQ